MSRERMGVTIGGSDIPHRLPEGYTEYGVAKEQFEADIAAQTKKFISSGRHVGHLWLPTHDLMVSATLALTKANHRRTLIVSLSQSAVDRIETAARNRGRHDISTYVFGRKDASGRIVNTTQAALIRDQVLRSERVELAVAIEKPHVAVGELSYLETRFPYAPIIYLTEGSGVIPSAWSRGTAKPQTQTEVIYELTLDHAVRRGLAKPLAVHLVETHEDMTTVTLTSDGEYRAEELAQVINHPRRNGLIVSLITGDTTYLRDGVGCGDGQELSTLQVKIAGKQILIYTLNNAHALQLAKQLNKCGVRTVADTGAEYQYNRFQKEILGPYRRGQIQVIVTTDRVRHWLDVPETEAVILASSTRYRDYVEKAVGGVITPVSSATNPGVVIQLVDKYKAANRPTKVPDLFSVTQQFETEPIVQAVPPLQLHGTSIQEYRSRLQRELLVASWFRTDSIDEIDAAVADIIYQANSQKFATVYDQYQKVASLLPGRVSKQAQATLEKGLRSEKSELQSKARQAFVTLYIRSFLSALDSYMYASREERDEVLLTVLTEAYLHPERFFNYSEFNRAIWELPREFILTVLLESYHVSLPVITAGKHVELNRKVDKFIRGHIVGTRTLGRYREELQRIAEDLGVEFNDVRSLTRQKLEVSEVGEVEDETDRQRRRELIVLTHRLLTSLADRDRQVLELRYGLNEKSNGMSLEEVGKELGVTRERIHQIEARALRELKRQTGLTKEIKEIY